SRSSGPARGSRTASVRQPTSAGVSSRWAAFSSGFPSDCATSYGTLRSVMARPQPSQPRSAPREGEVVIRRVSTTEEYEACVAIQMETWGSDFTERVPATILRVSQYIGGVTAGAFDTEGSLLGFVFGMTGLRDKQLVHWSDLLAVRRAARDRCLGRRLKLYHRDLVHELGVNTMFWTFDPLVARNAHLNLTRLGARVAEYAQDLYGEQLGRSLHPGLGTDRFIVQWDLASAPESRSSTVNDWAVPHRHDGRRPGVRDSAETP